MQALVFLNLLFRAADVADDLHDKDSPASVAELLKSLVFLQSNQFYQANANALSALMICGVLSWDVSNDMSLGPQQKYYADKTEQVLFYVAMVCGGYEHAKSIAREWIAQED